MGHSFSCGASFAALSPPKTEKLDIAVPPITIDVTAPSCALGTEATSTPLSSGSSTSSPYTFGYIGKDIFGSNSFKTSQSSGDNCLPNVPDSVTLPSFNEVANLIGFEKVNLSANVTGVTLPTWQSPIIPSFSRYSVSDEQPIIPQSLDIPNKPSDIDYSKFVVNLENYDNIYIPISVNLPNISSFSAVVVPEIPAFLENYKLPEIVMTFLDTSLLDNFSIPGLTKFNSDIKAGYIKRLGYQKDFFDFFDKDLLNAIYDLTEQRLDAIPSIDVFIAKLDVLLNREQQEFNIYFTGKQKKVLELAATTKAGISILKAKIDRFSVMLQNHRDYVEAVSVQNKELFDIWLARTEVGKAQLEFQRNLAAKYPVLFRNIEQLNNKVLDLFKMWNALLKYIVEAIIVNVNRERLIVENNLLKMNIKLAQQREELAIGKKEILEEINKSYIAKLKVLEQEFQNILAKASVFNFKVKTVNAELTSKVKHDEARLAELSTSAETTKIRSELQIYDKFFSAYRTIVDEYYSMWRQYYTTFYDIDKLKLTEKSLVDTIKFTQNKLDSFVKDNYNLIAQAWSYYLSTHKDAANMIAQSNIESRIIESYA